MDFSLILPRNSEAQKVEAVMRKWAPRESSFSDRRGIKVSNQASVSFRATDVKVVPKLDTQNKTSILKTGTEGADN